MCRKAKCKTCSKWTWAGCGKHIKQALAGIPEAELCKCTNHNPESGCTIS